MPAAKPPHRYELDTAEPVDGLGISRAELGKLLTNQLRLDSIRAYRREMDDLFRRFKLGQIRAKDLKDAVTALKAAVELLMTEKLLAANGQSDDAPDHPLGPDGGAMLLAPDVVMPTARLVTVKKVTGTDGKGQPINQTEVLVEGGPDMVDTVPQIAGGLAIEDDSEEQDVI